MSEEVTTSNTATPDLQDWGTPATEEVQDKPANKKAKKVFNRNDIKKTVDFKVNLPKLYPDYEPWGFSMRLKLSREAEEKRQEFLSLSAVEQSAKASEEALLEVCDLLVALPTGFEDLQDTGNGPGDSWRNYVNTAPTVESRELLLAITEGADNLYWNSISPREFR
jgi:hypothetical protein